MFNMAFEWQMHAWVTLRNALTNPQGKKIEAEKYFIGRLFSTKYSDLVTECNQECKIPKFI